MNNLYSQNLSDELAGLIYEKVPNYDITIEEFSNLCVNRVKFLRQIDALCENLKMMENVDIKINEKINRDFNTFFENDPMKNINSHFITRLAFCSEDEKTRWFINQEARLFKARISTYSTQDKKVLAQKLKIDFSPLKEQEFKEIESELRVLIGRKDLIKKNTISFPHFFKVYFKDALFLVSNLKCYLRRGMAYFYNEDISILLVNNFKEKLQKQMILARKHYLSVLDQDERLAPLLKNISDAYVGKDYSNTTTNSKKGKINLAELDILAKRNFPPCMRNLYDTLKINHHLRHEGRLQFGLFLKGAGLSYEDSYAFWKNEFTKKISNDQFEKNYAYNIRYNYGKEGKRADYNPRSCENIIKNHPPGNDEHHGCPFRHFSENNILILLKKMGVNTNDKLFTDVIEKVRGKHYQVACKYVFQILHPNRTGNIETEFDGQHPNSFFEASLNYYSGEKRVSNEAKNNFNVK